MPSAVPSESTTMSASNTPVSPSTVTTANARRASLRVLNRNIDKVVLGDLLFRTWYYSPYPDSVIFGDDSVAGNTHAHAHTPARTHANVNGKAEGHVDRNSTSTTTQTPRTPACECLHVCPYCFRYTSKISAYIQHLRRHNVTYNPYTRTSSPQPENDDINSPAPSSSDTSEDTEGWPVPSSAIKVYEHDGYAVWDIDGEREKLYCQNLSLFGKLFLEQKSVFFDTGGFHYFVLTYTPPLPISASPTSNTKGAVKLNAGTTRITGRRRASSAANPNTDSSVNADSIKPENPTQTLPSDISLHTRVLGFFSKENLSWDANNLACILVFPPYQHRNLGQLLMAVSYKLSGWEWEDSIIGGPEKPLSSMGRKSYLRFWSERVARFMMGQTADADGRVMFNDDDGTGTKKKRKKVGFNKEEVTVREIGNRTGMLAEDVVAALNEMGVLEVVPPKKKKRKSDGTVEDGQQEEVLSSMIVHRSKVLEWTTERGVDLVSPVREEGFLGEWALSEVDDDDEEDDDENTD